MKNVLMTVSTTIPEDITAEVERGERPQPDYIAMAKTFEADLIDYAAARKKNGRFGRWLEKVGGPELNLAFAAYRLRSSYRVIFTDGEQIGLPLAVLLKFMSGFSRPRHLMITHVLSVGKKTLLFDALRLQTAIDQFFVMSSFQKNYLIERLRVPPERVFFTPFMVDARFFNPNRVMDANPFTNLFEDRALICSTGREFRDYGTLVEAMRGVRAELIITTASLFSKRSDNTSNQDLPVNVHLNRYSYSDLRAMYAASRFVVVPLLEINFQAGVTSILEAMSMGKAVICSRVPGQTDLVVEGETGLYVPPGSPSAMRSAVQYLLDHPAEAERMGRNGRQRVLHEMTLEMYTERLSHFVMAAA